MRPAVRIVFAPIALRDRNREDPLRDAPKRGETCGRVVKLDPRMPDVGRTLYHELLHVRHPSWPEDRVAAAEAIGWQRMGWKAKARLYQLLGSARLEGEE